MTPVRTQKSFDISLLRATTIVALASAVVVVAALAVEMPRASSDTARAASMWHAVSRAPEAAPARAARETSRVAVAGESTAGAERETVPLRIHGVVSRAHGGEVGQAAVRAIAPRADLLSRLDDVMGVGADELIAASFEAPVDSHGSFSIAVPEAGAYVVVASGPYIAPVHGAAEPDGAPLALIAGESASLRGRVVNEKRESVARATISVIHPRGPAPKDASTTQAKIAHAMFQRVAETDDAGEFEIHGLDAGPFTLVCTTPGHASVKLVDVRPGLDPIEVRIHPACTVTGLVTDEKQRPVRGASVAVARCVGPRVLEESGDTVTTASGHYELSDVSSGGHGLVLQAMAPGFATRRVTLPALRAGEARSQNFVLDPATPLRVRVLGADGRACAGAYVEVYGLCDGSFLGGRETDADGRTVFDGTSAARRYRVMAKAAGHRVGTLPEVDPDRAAELRLLPSFTLHGFLVNEAGLPQHGHVRLRRESDREIVIEEQETTTDPQGAFQFDDLAPGVVTLVADAPEHAATESGPLPVGPDTVEAILKLDAGVAWSGRLVNEQGAPIAGARVYLPDVSRASGRARGLRGEPAVADARGAFELSNVSPAATSLVVVREGLAPAVVRVGESAARAAKRELGDLRLETTSALRGQVLDGRGQPVAGALVTLSGTHTIAAVAPRGETAADGTFSIAGLAAGSYALDLVDPAASALAGGFRRKTYQVELAPGETRVVTLDARDDARVRGRVRVSGGAPADPTEVALCAADHSGREIAAAEVDIDGSFELAAPRAGTLLLEVRSLDGPTVRASRLVTLAPRETREATIELGHASISGHVSTSGDRTPVPNAHVEIETDLGARWTLLADAEGRFRVNGLPAGVVSARALARGYAMAPPQTLRVAEGANATCGFELTPESVVTIQVTDSDQRPLAGARVAAWLEDATFLGDEKTDAKGEVHLRALAGGNLQIVVEHESYAQQRAPVSVAAGERIAQRVEMTRVATLVATLRAPKDQPAAFVDVTVTSPGGTLRTASTDERGIVRFDFSRDGMVSIVAEGFPKRELPVHVGETVRLSLSK